MAKLATRSREAAKRKAAHVAPEQRNVTTRRGGRVHLPNTVLDWPFPRCRTGAQTRQATHGRYVETTAEVNCEKCLEIAQALPQEPVNTAGRLKKAGRATAVEKPASRENNRSPRASRSQRNGVRQDEAAVKAAQIIGEKTNEIIAKRGTHVEMNEQRKDGCSDEEYALAVRVRELRAGGTAWWKIAYEMGLPGSGPSARQGKTGAAGARRLWEKAWGKTYTDTSVPRETKAIKAERAATQPGRPYFDKDATDDFIALSVPGHTIEWVARVGNDPQSAVHTVLSATVSGLHPIEVVQGPKGRVLKFYELPEPGSRVSGPLRSVYVDRIEKVSL